MLNAETAGRIITKVRNDEILSIFLKPRDVISHPGFSLTFLLNKETNERSGEYSDILEFRCNRVDSEDVYSHPEFFAQKLVYRLKNVNVAYGFIDQFPFDPASSYPFQYFQNIDPLSAKTRYWDNYVNGYFRHNKQSTSI